MKRRAIMVGLAMITGLPHTLWAKSGNGNASHAYFSWNTSYTPHYGAEGARKPLMDHISVAGAGTAAELDTRNTWRLEFSPPPPAVSNKDDPVSDTGMRAGFSLKMGF